MEELLKKIKLLEEENHTLRTRLNTLIGTPYDRLTNQQAANQDIDRLTHNRMQAIQHHMTRQHISNEGLLQTALRRQGSSGNK